jgi:hypothetical protein
MNWAGAGIPQPGVRRWQGMEEMKIPAEADGDRLQRLCLAYSFLCVLLT